MTAFFVPPEGFKPDTTDEQRYEVVAQLAERAPRPHGQRVESITFRSDGETWTATVGEELRGTRTTMVRRGGRQVEHTERLYGRSRVLGIFDGSPAVVVLDKALGLSRSEWEPVFFAGSPSAVRFFDAPAPDPGNS